MRRFLALFMLISCAALVAAGCGKYGKTDTGEKTETGDGKAKITTKKYTAAVAKKYGCTDPTDDKDYGHEHVNTGEEVPYKENPPTSGSHWSSETAPRPYGNYSEPVRDEEHLHNLEHGHIAVFYDGLKKSEVNMLKKWREKAPYHILLAPRPKNPKDGVYILGWTVTMYCEKPSAEALQMMIDRYMDQGRELIMGDSPKSED